MGFLGTLEPPNPSLLQPSYLCILVAVDIYYTELSLPICRNTGEKDFAEKDLQIEQVNTSLAI